MCCVYTIEVASVFEGSLSDIESASDVLDPHL